MHHTTSSSFLLCPKVRHHFLPAFPAWLFCVEMSVQGNGIELGRLAVILKFYSLCPLVRTKLCRIFCWEQDQTALYKAGETLEKGVSLTQILRMMRRIWDLGSLCLSRTLDYIHRWTAQLDYLNHENAQNIQKLSRYRDKLSFYQELTSVGRE